MRTRTKCTLAICGLLVIEILPVPVSSIYSLYVVRKRPAWLPNMVQKLYAEEPAKSGIQPPPPFHDPMVTRKKCTHALIAMFLVDLLVPVVIPTALFVVLKRPLWFHNLVSKLYSDLWTPFAAKPVAQLEVIAPPPELLQELDQKFAELERKNRAFAKRIGSKHAARRALKH